MPAKVYQVYRRFPEIHLYDLVLAAHVPLCCLTLSLQTGMSRARMVIQSRTFPTGCLKTHAVHKASRFLRKDTYRTSFFPLQVKYITTDTCPSLDISLCLHHPKQPEPPAESVSTSVSLFSHEMLTHLVSHSYYKTPNGHRYFVNIAKQADVRRDG